MCSQAGGRERNRINSSVSSRHHPPDMLPQSSRDPLTLSTPALRARHTHTLPKPLKATTVKRYLENGLQNIPHNKPNQTINKPKPIILLTFLNSE